MHVHVCLHSDPAGTWACKWSSHCAVRTGYTCHWQGYRLHPVSPKFHCMLEELLHLCLAVAERLVDLLSLIRRRQGHPLTVAAPSHLDIHHVLPGTFLKARRSKVMRSSHTALNRICSFESWIACSGKSRISVVRAEKVEAAKKGPNSL